MNKLAHFGDPLPLGARRQRVQIRDDEEALVGILKTQAIFQRANVMPEVELARWPIAGEDSFSFIVHSGERIRGRWKTVNAL